ncbi:ABC transporter permease [Amycolatopsis thermoflava]|uniref:ABC transporter permease n=1 Tax=Amycolatopsis thermoflava TaxID=84480 RepID=UPI00366991FB
MATRSAVAPARARSPWRRLRPWLSTVVIVLVWYLCAVTGVLSPNTLPGPDRILLTAWREIADGTLGKALLVSLGRVASGAALGVTAGLALGVLAGFSRVGEDVVDRPMQMVRTIPFTALVPLFILWFGLGQTPKVLLIAVASAVPMYLNTFAGVRDVDRKLVEVAQLYRLGRLRTARTVLLPGALPSVLTGLRFALGNSWIAVIIAETVNSDAGIGFLLVNAQQFIATDVVVLCIAVYALLGLVTDWLVRLLERSLLTWRNTFTGT